MTTCKFTHFLINTKFMYYHFTGRGVSFKMRTFIETVKSHQKVTQVQSIVQLTYNSRV